MSRSPISLIISPGCAEPDWTGCRPSTCFARGIAGSAVVAAALQHGRSTELSMEDLWRLSATDVAAAIKSKKVSAKEVATSALGRLDAVNPAINAVVDHRPEDVLAQAAEVDATIARGEDPGLLAGVPVTIKVNIDQKGFANTNGLKLQRDAIATENS